MKILEFFGEPLSYGGQESFIINMYKNFSKDNKYTFCTPFHVDNKELIELTQRRQDIIVAFKYRFLSRARKYYIYKSAKKILSENFDIVHIHSGSVMTLLLVSYLAKKKRTTRVIVHSHATGYMSRSHSVVKSFSDRYIEKYADLFLACSLEAGRFKFPNQVINSDKFRIIKNGIDLEKYRFDKITREKKRHEINVEGKTVLCNVGRFSPEKNHEFIIEVFNEYFKINDNSVLLLIGGNGPAETEMKNKIKDFQISDKVIILKNRTDINELLCASDIFIFASLFEGLGISAIEAQASGLPTICANHLPDELRASNCYVPMKLNNNPKEWAQKVQSLRDWGRNDDIEQLRENGYDIRDCSRELEELYGKDNK